MTRFVYLSVLLSALVGLFCFSIAAQETPSRVINGGILNGKATSLPKPVYPESLRQSGVGGIVVVNIVIDEAGGVVSAEADAEPMMVHKTDADPPRVVDPLLRAAAEEAARRATFRPTLLQGRPVRITGKIMYNFVPTGSEGSETGGQVLNGRAKSLPAPEYPAAAQAVRAQGTVSVAVTIDEDGSVISANAISGHPLLRSSAAAAARTAKFSPTVVDNQPVRVSGVLTYNFVLDERKDQ